MRAIESGDVSVSRVNGTQETYVIGHIAEDISASGLVLTDPELTIGREAAISRGYERRRADRKVWLFDGPEWFDIQYIEAQPPQVADLDLG